jgi:hypothetical protein
MAVGGVADHAGAVGRSAFGDEEIGAGIGFAEAENESQGHDCSKEFFHIAKDLLIVVLKKSAQK